MACCVPLGFQLSRCSVAIGCHTKDQLSRWFTTNGMKTTTQTTTPSRVTATHLPAVTRDADLALSSFVEFYVRWSHSGGKTSDGVVAPPMPPLEFLTALLDADDATGSGELPDEPEPPPPQPGFQRLKARAVGFLDAPARLVCGVIDVHVHEPWAASRCV